MDPKRPVVRHFLAALAYRTQKALRGAPEGFTDFRAADNVRTPHELMWHITGVLGYARTFFIGGVWQPERVSFSDEVRRFHELLQDVDRYLDAGTEWSVTVTELFSFLFRPDKLTRCSALSS